MGEVSACVVIYSAIIFNEGEGLAPLPFDPIIRALQNPKLYRLASLLDRLICWERRENDLKRGAVLTKSPTGDGSILPPRRERSWPTARSPLARLKPSSGEISRLGERALPLCVAACHQATLIVAAHPLSNSRIGRHERTTLAVPLAASGT